MAVTAAFEDLGLTDIAALFGVESTGLDELSRTAIADGDFAYRRLSPAERDEVLLRILKKLDSKAFARSGEVRRGVWDAAWSERAQEFAAAGFGIQGLLPSYIDVDAVVRLSGEFALPCEPGFEQRFSSVFRPWLFRRYLNTSGPVFEFGCGSGFNLVTLAEVFPERELFGLDWAPAAVELVDTIASARQLPLRGLAFDFFAPDERLRLGPGSAVLTVCALEQVGERHEAFLRFLLDRAPAVCVHMEPLLELYEQKNLIDYLAIRYHKERGYLDGFLPNLRRLEAEGRIRVEALHRVRFGNLYHEGYSYVVWRPAGNERDRP